MERKSIKQPNEFYCEVCGRTFSPNKHLVQKYCSRECYFEWKHQNKKVHIIPRIFTTCDICGSLFEATSWRQRLCSRECQLEDGRRRSAETYKENRSLILRVCKRCGNEFEPRHGNQKDFCSKTCAKAYSHYYNRKKYKGKYKDYNPVLTYKIVYKKDKGLCKLCGLPVIEDKLADSYWSGTVDHIIPITRGGKGSIENCQLAHRICNALKSNETDFKPIDWKTMGKEKRWRVPFLRLESFMETPGA